MQCDEVIRELAAPTDDRDATTLAEHLAGCPTCASWALRANQLDRLWKATRPSEPSSESWNAVWVQIVQSLERSIPASDESIAAARPSWNGSAAQVIAQAPRVRREPGSRSWSLGAIGLIGLAQAAAVLVALGFAWRTSTRPLTRYAVQVTNAPASVSASPSGVKVASPVKIDWEIDEGRTLVFRAEGPGVRVDDLTSPEMAYGFDHGLDLWYEMFNSAESLDDNPRIASR
jgi:hypothetical protein